MGKKRTGFFEKQCPPPPVLFYLPSLRNAPKYDLKKTRGNKNKKKMKMK
jgi:hypothetical protein